MVSLHPLDGVLPYRRASGFVASSHNPIPSITQKVALPHVSFLKFFRHIIVLSSCYWNRISLYSPTLFHLCTPQVSLPYSHFLFTPHALHNLYHPSPPRTLCLPVLSPAHPFARTLHELSHRRFCIRLPIIFRTHCTSTDRLVCIPTHSHRSPTPSQGKRVYQFPSSQSRPANEFMPRTTFHSGNSIYGTPFRKLNDSYTQLPCMGTENREDARIHTRTAGITARTGIQISFWFFRL